MAISLEVQEKAKEIIRSELTSRLTGRVRIETIRATPMLDATDDEFLQVSVVYEGNRKDLDPGVLNGLHQQIKPRLLKLGIQTVPSVSYINKTEDSLWSEMAAARPPDERE